ncbi:MAG: cytochrome c [Acidobacteria bacterium]|nr:cytochrome c [Acidobacteriota bacterium]NIM61432.1 cytochrome c [Acidobacteriota bacterium]NIO58095.1 cytochrome c [Acidobacteriota bacterium]NIQ29104.1 cytochrome c [Acidobacteriota bacterium]NIQ83648.1 cytochrome c [Acidobacteriota bacterium]
MRRLPKLALLAVAALTLTGCMRGCTSPRPPIHINPNMDYQPRVNAQAESDFFYDGRAMRMPIPGTVARGELRTEPPHFYTGRDENGEFIAISPVGATEEVLAHGLHMYTIYCQPCHEKRGTGKGIMYEYGNVPVPSFYADTARDYPDGEVFDIVTNGKGLMQGYGYPLAPADRWAVIAHVRQMQAERPREATP